MGKKNNNTKKGDQMEDIIYDHYIAIDWAAINMAIARMTKKSNKITVIDVPSDVVELQIYLKKLKGTKVLAVEETTTSQWLYTELKEYVDKILICDPYRNRLLSEGPKTDKIDASKLVQLLKTGLMKEVYHSTNQFIYLRQLVSSYEDLVQAGVRLKNQRYSLLRVCGKTGYEKKDFNLPSWDEQYVLKSLNRRIENYEQEKKEYAKEFGRLAKKHIAIRHQKSIPGIGLINAVKIVARIVTPYRFANKGHYLSYAGLIKHEKISGGRSYGKKNPRYCRMMKCIYKSGVMAAISGNNPINNYYEYLINKKYYPAYNARHKACRQLAIISFGVFKSAKKYKPNWRNHVETSLA